MLDEFEDRRLQKVEFWNSSSSIVWPRPSLWALNPRHALTSESRAWGISAAFYCVTGIFIRSLIIAIPRVAENVSLDLPKRSFRLAPQLVQRSNCLLDHRTIFSVLT